MAGCDISDKESMYIIETTKLPLDVFLHVAGDYAFFFAEAKNMRIISKEVPTRTTSKPGSKNLMTAKKRVRTLQGKDGISHEWS